MAMNRDKFGRFCKKASNVGLVVIVLALICLATYPVFMSWMEENLKTTISYQAEAMVLEVDKSDEMFAAKIDKLKNDVVAELEKCESGGKKEEDGIVILDSNNRGSYGVVQWQRTSVQHYYKLRTGEEINGRDAIILALTAVRARDLAKWVMFETKSGVEKDWTNCSKLHGLQSKVDMIKSLEK